MRKSLAVLLVAFVLVAGLTPPAGAVESIEGLRVTRTEARKLVLNWIPEPGAQTYEIIRDGANVGTSDNTWFVAAGLDVQTAYTFVIRASNGAESEPATFTTAPVTPAPTTIDVWWVGPKGATLAFGFGEFEIRRDGEVVASRNGRVFRDTSLTPETTYTYQVRPIGAAGNLGPASQQTITTKPLLDQVQGVQAELLEPGIVSVTWQSLGADTRYRVFVDGALKSAPTSPGATSAQVAINPGANSVIQVGAYNGGGGPLSDSVSVTSPDTDPRQIGLRVHASWPGTVVLNWRPSAVFETVLFNGTPVGTGNRGWITIRDLPFNERINVTVRTETSFGPRESITYPIRTATVQLFDVRNFVALSATSNSVKLGWRKDPFVDFELLRDGVVVATITQADRVPYTDTGLTPGTTYTYSIRQVAAGATGVSNPVSVTVTTPAR